MECFKHETHDFWDYIIKKNIKEVVIRTSFLNMIRWIFRAFFKASWTSGKHIEKSKCIIHCQRGKMVILFFNTIRCQFWTQKKFTNTRSWMFWLKAQNHTIYNHRRKSQTKIRNLQWYTQWIRGVIRLISKITNHVYNFHE